MRRSLTVLVLVGAMAFATAVAEAEPSFVLSESSARPGEAVHFSISGIDDAVSYALEVDGDELIEGRAPGDGSIAGAFTMPNLGETSRTVTVEVQITQSDETTRRQRSLTYLPPQAPAPSGPEPAAVLAAPAERTAPASASAPRSLGSAPAVGTRHARRSPPRSRDRRSRSHQGNGSQHLAQSDRGPAGTAKAASRDGRATRAGAKEGSRSAGGKSTGRRHPARHVVASDEPTPLAKLLTFPPAGALSLAAAVPGDGTTTFPVAALIILPLLCLSALMFVGGVSPTLRRGRFTYLPRTRRMPGVRRKRSSVQPSRTDPRQISEPPNDLTGDTEIETVAVALREVAASFSPIPLAVLDERAALATRAERKYILDARTFEQLIGELIPYYSILEIGAARVFPYDTMYFDTPTLVTYRQHLQERRRRFKCRTRRYSEAGPCFFEVKLKGGRGETIKERLALSVEEHGSVTPAALDFLAQQLESAYGAAPPAPLDPVLRTSYRRLTLAGITGAERLTFDFELSFAGDGGEYAIRPGRVLLEAKTDARAGSAGRGADRTKKLLRRLGVRPVGSCSKYCLGVALSHPEERSNLFRPLIRRHFAEPSSPAEVPDAEPMPDAEPAPVAEAAEPHPGFVRAPAWQGMLAMWTRR
jgi:VTC domain-containing protein